MEEFKKQELQCFEYRKQILEAETRLKQQQNLYEACRSDRNLYSKNLVEANDEMATMKRKLKIMTHQIEQLKDEISSRKNESKRHEEKLGRVEKESSVLKERLQRDNLAREQTQSELDQMSKEVKSLNELMKSGWKHVAVGKVNTLGNRKIFLKNVVKVHKMTLNLCNN